MISPWVRKICQKRYRIITVVLKIIDQTHNKNLYIIYNFPNNINYHYYIHELIIKKLNLNNEILKKYICGKLSQ